MNFNEFLSARDCKSTYLLPLTHIIRGIVFEQFLNIGRLNPGDLDVEETDIGKLKPCEVFDEFILYFFYGRFAYKFPSFSPGTLVSWKGIVALFVKPNSLKSIRAVYPFDTGGYSRGFFRDFVGDDNLINYRLGSDLEDVLKFIEIFYENNSNYLTFSDYLPTRNFSSNTIGHSDCISSYINLIRNAAMEYMTDVLDEQGDEEDRAVSIEIQTLSAISLPSSLEAIIVPLRYKRKYERKVNSFSNNITVLSYRGYDHTNTGGYHRAIKEVAKQYYEDRYGEEYL